jgi:adhesion G protein-coupled receptor L1
LPRGALVEHSEGGLVRIVFVAFDRLEVILRPTSIMQRQAENSDSSNLKSHQNSSSPLHYTDEVRANQPQRVINSKVISASLGKGRHIQLSQPIRLVLRHLRLENVTNPSCVFWSYIDQYD